MMKKNEIKGSAYFVLCLLKQYESSVKPTRDRYSISTGLKSILASYAADGFHIILNTLF